MQKKENLISTEILLTTLKGYEKLMNSDEREKFYKMIQNFSYAESTLNHLEEELEQQMTDFEDSQAHVIKTFEFIMKQFDEFIKKYDEMSKNVIDSPYTVKEESKENIDKNLHKCGDECKCNKNLKEFKEFLSSEEGDKLIANLFSLFNGELEK